LVGAERIQRFRRADCFAERRAPTRCGESNHLFIITAERGCTWKKKNEEVNEREKENDEKTIEVITEE
jgi:hypothetical protein